jgi:competence protein ComEC
LFTGDIEKDGEEALLSTNKTLASEILKVPHHGSRTSSSLALLDAVSPQMAVASLGSHNRFHFPASEVIRRYAEKGSVLLQTDRVGTVTVISNRQTWHLETTHPSAQEVGEEVATPFAHKKKDASLSP